MTEQEWPYWSVDLPGLTAQDADALLKDASSLSSVVGATVVDPHDWWTEHLDRATVSVLVRGLLAGLESGRLDEADAWDIEQYVEELQAWLATSERTEGQ